MSEIFRDFKSHTSKEIAARIDTVFESRRGWMLELFSEVADGLKRVPKYKVWQDGNHPILCDSNNILDQKLDYIHNNLVAEEIVCEPEHYLYSSARDYCITNLKGLLEIDFI